jgi:opacity protein-like surface antigen
LQYEATSLDGALSGLQGSLFSGRYHFSGQQALRVGVSVNASIEDEDEVNELRRDAPAMDRTEQRSEQDSQDYVLSVEYVHYVRPTDQLFVYAGAGPRVGYNTSNQKRTLLDQGGSRSEKDMVERTAYRIGLTGALGVEWFVHPHISLSVEYPLAVEYINGDEESTSRLVEDGSVEREQTSTTETDRYEIGGEAVQVGVTFSFGP